MNKNILYKKLAIVEKIAGGTRLRRFLYHPFRYFFSILFRELFYSMTKRGIALKTNTFFDIPMKVILPAGTDLYLTGGKSHESEIRLARFMIRHLSANDTFVDIGAHYGYFSLLASALVGDQGKVISIEASKSTFKILEENTEKTLTVRRFNNAISNVHEEINFYEFPVLYSEYNTSEVEQFENESWYKKFNPTKTKVQGIPLDEVIISNKLIPALIKIDVEGSEFKVISGFSETLQKQKPIIVMEFLNESRHNVAHQKAIQLLKEFNYSSFLINKEGYPETCEDVNAYLNHHKLESDNIVFIKNQHSL